MANTDYDNILISSMKKDEELESFIESKRKELEKMIPGFGGKELTRTVLNFYERGIRDGIGFGMTRIKQQMMKDAVDGIAQKNELMGWLCIERGVMTKALEKYNDGDKLKLKIIKED